MHVLKNIWLGLALIAAASAVLLISDLGRRESARVAATGKMPRLAVMQFASTDLLDSTVAGIVEGLREQGFEDGRTASIRFFNASGDSATANLMARELTGGAYDLVLTASTLALQAVAKANRERRVLHVFGGVTDPYGAGVDITGPEPHQHPPYMTGVGTFQPVDAAIRMARAMNPSLQRLGVVWSPAEDNSEACLRVARATCAELGITLVEANAGNTSEVPEAIRSVLGRNVDAIWIGGDTVAMSSINAIIGTATAAGVPVFTNDPTDAQRGALFGLGASYHQVGRTVGEMGGKILRGAKPSDFGVANLVPEILSLNDQVAGALPAWSIPPAARAQAEASSALISRKAGPAPGRHYKVGLIYIGPHPIFELAIAGLKEGLRERGFVEGENMTILPAHANNDMSILPQIIQRARDQEPDAIVVMSTPVLAAVIAVEKKIPIVFGVVSAPLDAGAGASHDDHLPNVTGAVWTAPNPDAFAWLKRLFPDVRRIGVIYNASEANSVRELSDARAIVEPLGMEFVARTIQQPNEIIEVTRSLLNAPVDAVFGMADNTVVGAFPALAQACRQARIPLLADDGSLMGGGALFSIGASPHGEGRATARLVARVLSGERPGKIPFVRGGEPETVVDFDAAAHLGLTFPDELLKRASVFHNIKARFGRPAHVAIVNLVEASALELGHRGILRGLREAGIEPGKDIILHDYNAQGDIAQLPALIDAALNKSPDLVITITTPALMAAAKRVRNVPLVYAIASNPTDLELYTPDQRPANITGVHDDPPVDKLLDLAIQQNPGLTAAGVVYDAAQPNAVISIKKLRAACRERGIALHETTASTLSDLGPATQTVIQRGAGVLILSADNLTTSGFPVIHQVCQRAGVPVYTTSVNLVAEGAVAAIGDDYEAWGAQAARLAALALVGIPLADLPPEPTRTVQMISAKTPPRPMHPAQRPRELRIVRFNDAQFSADSERGIRDGLREAGLVEGRDFAVRVLNAQGDMATLNAIMDTVNADAPDLVMAISTPTLQAALRQAARHPVIFCSVGDAVRAGAGSSVTDHLPHVTGITTKSPFEGMAKLIRTAMPWVKTVGTLYSPAEINSELYREWFEEALKAEGLALKSIPVNTSAEVAEATTALLQSGVQVIGQIADNATRPGYAQIARRTRDAGLAFLVFDSAGIHDGAALALARDYYANGIEAAGLAVRVLNGESPATIPFTNTRSEVLVINPALLREFNINLPADLLAQAIVYEP